MVQENVGRLCCTEGITNAHGTPLLWSGLGSVPWALLGEMFGADVKAVSSSACATFYWALGFLVTQFFGRTMEGVGADYTFWGLAVCCVLAAVFTLTFLPDTKGKSLKEIQDILNGDK